MVHFIDAAKSQVKVLQTISDLEKEFKELIVSEQMKDPFNNLYDIYNGSPYFVPESVVKFKNMQCSELAQSQVYLSE